MRLSKASQFCNRGDSDNSDQSSSPSSKAKKCCCGRCKDEWQLPMFSLIDTNGKTIDLNKTLAPQPRIINGIIKAIILVWNISVLVQDIESFSAVPKVFYLAYLTRWGLLIMTACNFLNFFRFFFHMKDDSSYHYDNQQGYNGYMLCLTWIVSTVTINIASLIVILYWTLEYDGRTITYLNVMVHGVIALLTTIDVVVINRLPIRFKQIIFVLIFELLYLTWTIIHSQTDIGNPNSTDADPDTDDDSIYDVLNWTKRPIIAIIVSVIVLVVATPILFFSLWFLSTLFKPRYVDTHDTQLVINIDAFDEEDKGYGYEIRERKNTIDFSNSNLDGEKIEIANSWIG
jgi:hypothetical protein